MATAVAFAGSAIQMNVVLELLWPATLTDVSVANVVLPTVSTSQKTNNFIWVNKRHEQQQQKKNLTFLFPPKHTHLYSSAVWEEAASEMAPNDFCLLILRPFCNPTLDG